jgi:hypothetical protein
MPGAPDPPVLAAARELLSRPLTLAEVLAKLPGRDRANAERRVAVLAGQPDASPTPAAPGSGSGRRAG